MNWYHIIHPDSSILWTASGETEKEIKIKFIKLLEKYESKLSVAGVTVKRIS